MKFFRRLGILAVKPVLAGALALAGAAVYLAQTIYYAFTQMSMLDEGQFLYKGLMYATGVYRPFQEYGFWTHKAPLSYLILGFLQSWFGPGLGVGRFFAVLISLLGLYGLWLAARRLGGNWWAAAVVWALALNPVMVKFYSIASVEGLVSCLLVWSVAFAVGEKRRVPQLVLSAALATVMVLCRQNMMPFLPFLLVYIWWQYGWKSFAWATGASLIIFLGVHALYWPDILRMWAPFVPQRLAPFLDAWRPPRGDSAPWFIDIKTHRLEQVKSFFEGFRYHFIALTGGAAAILFAARRREWKDRRQFKTFVFLAVSFVILVLLHLWLGTGNSDSNNYNIWGFTPYLSFFVSLGLLLVVLTFSTWGRKLSKFIQLAAVLMVLVLSTGIGFASFETFGYSLMEVPAFRSLNKFVLGLPIPRFNDFFHTWRFSKGTVPLLDALVNKFGGDPYVLALDLARWMDPAVVGLLAGAAVLLVSILIWKIIRRIKTLPAYSYGATVMIVFLLVGSLLSPTVLLGGDYKIYDCGCNVIANFKQAGQSLAQVIPAGSQVYWDGGNAISVLLSIPDVRVFPQQIDENWSYWTGGDPEALARYGFWNESLKSQWQQEAGYIIIQQNHYTAEWDAFFSLNSGKYEEVPLDQVPLGCSPDTYLRVFHRK
jgi:hypothetical protein